MVANIAVILNVLLTVAFMILFHAAFTLSGLAGLALTVGMAVDANVLIYERMREELGRGATLRMAIRNGFDRATTTIIDANVTTLISAVVLFYIGTDQVKGFAVTLILGIVMNLFTAITVSRAIFDMAERNRWVTQLRMMQMMSKANYDFIGKRKLAIGAERDGDRHRHGGRGGPRRGTAGHRLHRRRVGRNGVRQRPSAGRGRGAGQGAGPARRHRAGREDQGRAGRRAVFDRHFRARHRQGRSGAEADFQRRVGLQRDDHFGGGADRRRQGRCSARRRPATWRPQPLVPDDTMLALADEPAAKPKDADAASQG